MLRRAFSLSSLALVVTLAALPARAQDRAQDVRLTAFAAASMKNAVDDINAAFTKATGIKVVSSYAASSALAKQIESGRAGRPVCLRRPRMDGLRRRQEAHQGRHPYQSAGQPSGADRAEGFQDQQRDHRPGFDLARLAGDGRIATGDVRAVPVGKYAKAALEKLGAWTAAEPKFAMAENVRAALTLVGRGEAALGIVYETDAKVEPNVKIVAHFPEDSHPPIVYPVALTANAKPDAVRYISFHALRPGEDDLRNLWLHVPDQADVMTS